MQPHDTKKAFYLNLVCTVSLLCLWTVWQIVGIEAMRPPWEDEVLLALPGINWAESGSLALPQMGTFLHADQGWRFHVPFFPLSLGLWVKCFGIQLETIRLFTLLAAAALIAITARLCQSISGFNNGIIGIIWLIILMGDKSLVTNSLSGRMEPWCLLFFISAMAVSLRAKSQLNLFVSGVLLGTAVGFHPLAIYLFPGFVPLIIYRTSVWEKRVSPIVSIAIFSSGFLLTPGFVVVWLLTNWALTQEQFLSNVKGSSASGLAKNMHDMCAALIYNFRFQPTLIAAFTASVLLVSWKATRRSQSSDRWFHVSLLVFIICYVLFLLRGSSTHLYYFQPLVILAILLIAASVSIIREMHPTIRIGMFGLISLLLINNLAFAAGKTLTVWKNRDILDPTEMNAYLSKKLRRGTRCVISPNLWLYCTQRGIDFRVNYFQLVGQPASTYKAYLQNLLDWKPDTIVLDSADRQERKDRYFSDSELAEAGYVRDGYYERVFRDRFKYDGYRLEFYTKQNQTAIPDTP
jgi:hypothetical protein